MKILKKIGTEDISVLVQSGNGHFWFTCYLIAAYYLLKICFPIGILGLSGFYNLLILIFSICKHTCSRTSLLVEAADFEERLNSF